MSLQPEVRRLRVLALAAAGEVSAKDASEALDVNLVLMAYYVRDLAARKPKLLYVSKETRVRGAVQTHYRITPEGEAYLAESLNTMRDALDALRPESGLRRATG
jgi:predicted transcriptional regulator